MTTCRACGATGEPLPIVFGYPTDELFEQARRGEVVLGGCIVSDDDPEFACAICTEPVDPRAPPRMA